METVTIILDYISTCGAYTTTVTIDNMHFCSTCLLYEQKQNTRPKSPEDIENIDILYLEYSSDKSIKHFVFKYNGRKFRIVRNMINSVRVSYTLSHMTSSGEWEELKESSFCDIRSFYELVKYVKAIY